MSGIGPETALGRVVSIRAEDDPERLKSFTPEMRQMRAAWRTRAAKEKAPKERDDFLAGLLDGFKKMAGQSKPGAPVKENNERRE